MKNLFTYWKAIIAIFIFVTMAFVTNAQNWTEEKSSLYYVGLDGKVFIEPDYSAAAIYFEDDAISETTFEKFNSKVRTLKSTSEENIKLMNKKGVMLIKDVGSMKLRTVEERQSFLKDYELAEQGAYDVLPAFDDRGVQVFLTKRVSISFKDGYTYDDFAEIFEKYGATHQRTSLNGYFDVFNVEKLENQFSLIQELDDLGVLNWGGPDFKSDIKKFYDPDYQYQWHLHNTGGTSYNGSSLVSDIDIDAPEAWAITTGSTSVTVAVIDDGIDASHEDMPTPLTGYTPANNGDGTPDVSDDGHGQLVAGLIVAQHDNNLVGKGVAPGVSYFSVNIFASGTSNSDVADGITWAVNQGADILSNSWGWSSCSYNDASVTSAFSNAATNGRGGLGCVILVASGNDSYSCVAYPANLSTVFGVGGISGDAERSNFSNYGSDLDICAPSDDNWSGGYPSGDYGYPSTDRMGNLGWTNSSVYYYFGGTSGATPLVSGVAALVLSVDATLTKSEVENILTSTANTSFSDYNSNEYGAGMVNAYDAVVAAGGGSNDTEAPTTPTGLASSNIGSSSFDLSWNASTDNVGVTGYKIYLGGNLHGTSSGTSTTVSGLSQNTTYSVQVSAYDAAGNESGLSTAINVTTTESSISCSSTITSFPYSQSFESGAGDWTQSSNDDFDWTNNSGSTPSTRTGPSSAYDGSYYMYIEATGNLSQEAILNSPCFDLTNETTASFDFAYHMYGRRVASLALELTTDDTNWSTIWSLSGDQGDSWFTESIDLTSYAGSIVKLRFVGTAGTRDRSDIAIDGLSLTTSGGSPGGDNDLVLTIVLDNYPEETSWTLDNDGGTTVASGGTYGSEPDGSTLVININNLDDDCYDFTISDSYGDGICCSYGSGSYTLETSGGTVLASGGNFSYSETTSFCLPTTSFNFATTNSSEILAKTSFKIYPNPVNDILYVEAINFNKEDQLKIYDVSGRLVLTKTLNEVNTNVDISDLSSGVYFIKIADGSSSKNNLKFIKR